MSRISKQVKNMLMRLFVIFKYSKEKGGGRRGENHEIIENMCQEGDERMWRVRPGLQLGREKFARICGAALVSYLTSTLSLVRYHICT